MNKKKGIFFRVTEDFDNQISDYAHQAKMNKSEFIRYCLQEQIERMSKSSREDD